MKKNQHNRSSVELLAPGGSADAVKAAIIAGADAVYCGLPQFNARQRADNLTAAQLPELVTIAHQHACRIYLTLNTLILDSEIDTVLALIASARAAGVDAVIVQDFGLLYLLRTCFPDCEVHASTQMTTHNVGQIALLAHAGVTQVNLCRELSLDEISALCSIARESALMIEVFVYGAYCISFSGQCYMSCAMSGKSGNRGACVQPCRRTYTAGSPSTASTPLNLRDNSAFAHAEALIHAGVASFKIEGRIKGYKYVYATVNAWRRQIDRINSGRAAAADDGSLRTVFNRSLSAGYLDGTIGPGMFIDSSRDQSLQQVGRIRSYTADTGTLTLEREVRIDPETPVLIYTNGFTFICTGFLTEQTGRFSYRLTITHKLKGKISSGDMLYRQAEFDGPADLRQRIDSLQVRKATLRFICSGTAGKPLVVECRCGDTIVSACSAKPLAAAASRPLTAELLTEKLGMLGETSYVLESVDRTSLDVGLFIPVSEINNIRRQCVAQLPESHPVATAAVTVSSVDKPKREPGTGTPVLAVLTDRVDDFSLQYDPGTRVLHELPVTRHDYVGYFSALFTDFPHIVPWFPAILIGNHYSDAAALVRRQRFPCIVSDNSGIGWEAGKAETAWIAGPLLNTANSFTMKAYATCARCRGAFISHELSREQMAPIAASEGFSLWYTVYAPLLLMNTRQCIARNVTACQKEHTDGQCLVTCERSATISDGKSGVFTVLKRRGFYNQIYNHRSYFNPAVVKDLGGGSAVFLADIRSIPGKTTVRCSRQELVSLFEAFVRGEAAAADLRAVINDTTAAQYTRGI